MYKPEKYIPEKGSLPIAPPKRKSSLIFLVPVTVSLFIILTTGLSVYLWYRTTNTKAQPLVKPVILSTDPITDVPINPIPSPVPIDPTPKPAPIESIPVPTNPTETPVDRIPSPSKLAQPPAGKKKFSFMAFHIPRIPLSKLEGNYKVAKNIVLLAHAIPQIHYDKKKEITRKQFVALSDDSDDSDDEKSRTGRGSPEKKLRSDQGLFGIVASHYRLRGLKYDNTIKGSLDENFKKAMKLNKSSPPPLIFWLNALCFPLNFNFNELNLTDEAGNKYTYKAVATLSHADNVFYRGQFEEKWTPSSRYTEVDPASRPEYVESAAFTLYAVNDVLVNEEEMKTYIRKYKKQIFS